MPTTNFPLKRSGGQREPKPFRELAIVFTSLLLVVVGLQCAHGAYWAAFDGYPDEPSHVVTSLMYRQFMVAPTFAPLDFAKQYYSHYPYLAAGHWPPGFHVPAAIWMLIVGAGRIQLQAYLALIMASTATILYYCIRSFGSATLAGVFCGAWLLLPQSQAAMTRFMAEGQSALLVTAACTAYVSYLKAPGHGRGILFGLLATGAILTKETGLSLALVPPLSVAITRRWDLLRKSHYWLPAVVVVVLAGTWYWWIDTLGIGRWGASSTVFRVLEISSEVTVWSRLSSGVQILGWPLLAMSVWGIQTRIWSTAKDRQSSSQWIVYGSLLVGGVAFHLLVPESIEVRHLYHLTPGLLLFAAAGAFAAMSSLAPNMKLLAGAALGLCGIVATSAYGTLPHKATPNSLEIVSTAERLRQGSAERILLSGTESKLAGPLIAEIALRDHSPKRYLFRASKTLYSVNWSGYCYESRISTDEEMQQFLDESGVDTIIRPTEVTASPQLHEILLTRQLESTNSTWRLLDSGPASGLEVYERAVASSTPRRPVRLHMKTRWGVDMQIPPSLDDVHR